MEIRVWQSYSCNNSSSYWLVAKFDDPKVVKDSAAELATLFKAHAKEIDKSFDSGDDDDAWERPSKVALEFAKTHGFTWKNYMMWGDGGLEGDEPEIAAEGDKLVLYHGYCGGGLPSEIGAYIKKKGGKVIGEDDGGGDLSMSLIVELTSPKAAIVKDVEKAFKDVPAPGSDDDDEDGGEAPVPWEIKKRNPDEAYGKMAYFCDGKTLGLFFPIEPRQLPAVRKWVAKGGGKNESLVIQENANFKKFRTISQAKCTECGSQLEYLDPRKTGIDSEQLACAKCGGMFDLATFKIKKKKKKPEPAPPAKKGAAVKKKATKKPAAKKGAAVKKKGATKATAKKKSGAKKK